MSSSAAGKFQDYYHVLGVDPKATSDVIQSVYAKLAQKYHPNNRETGDPEKFKELNEAYEVLADPASRREFDKVKGGGDDGAPKFSGPVFFEALGRETGLRTAVLCVLYDRRRLRPFTPSLSLRHLESILECNTEELNFALWYLKQRSFAASDDKSSLLITVEGMDYLEAMGASAERVMPFIKPSALIAKNAAKPADPVPVLVPAVPVDVVESEPANIPRVGSRLVGMLKSNGGIKAQ